MELRIIVAIATVIVLIIVIGVDHYRMYRDETSSRRLPKLDKQITDYLTQEGYEWRKEEGVLSIKRRGALFRVFLRPEGSLKTASLWIQYAVRLEEQLSPMNWGGKVLLVNVLSDKHVGLNISLNTEENVLWVHYRADIRSKEEFAYHFDNAIETVQELWNDCNDLIPKLQADFPARPLVQKQSIGFA